MHNDSRRSRSKKPELATLCNEARHDHAVHLFVSLTCICCMQQLQSMVTSPTAYNHIKSHVVLQCQPPSAGVTQQTMQATVADCGSRHGNRHETGYGRCTCIPSMWRSCFDAGCTAKLLPACLKENQGTCLVCRSPAFLGGMAAECGENSVGAFCNSASADEGVFVADWGLCSKQSHCQACCHKHMRRLQICSSLDFAAAWPFVDLSGRPMHVTVHLPPTNGWHTSACLPLVTVAKSAQGCRSVA